MTVYLWQHIFSKFPLQLVCVYQLLLFVSVVPMSSLSHLVLPSSYLLLHLFPKCALMPLAYDQSLVSAPLVFYQWKQFLLSFLLIHNSLPRSSIIFILTDWSSDCSILLIALPQNLIRMIKCKSRFLLKLSLSALLPISAWNRSLLLFLQLLLLLWLLFCYLHDLHFFLLVVVTWFRILKTYYLICSLLFDFYSWMRILTIWSLMLSFHILLLRPFWS